MDKFPNAFVMETYLQTQNSDEIIVDERFKQIRKILEGRRRIWNAFLCTFNCSFELMR